jgi:nitrogen regulatory protein PII
MMKVEAIVSPSSLDDLREELSPWVTDMTMTEVSSLDHGHEHVEIYRGVRFAVEIVRALRVELVVAADLVPRVEAALERAVRAHVIGDGLIRVTPIEVVIQVRAVDQPRGLSAAP